MPRILTLKISDVRGGTVTAIKGKKVPFRSSHEVVWKQPDRRRMYTSDPSTEDDIILYWGEPDQELSNVLQDNYRNPVSFYVPDDFLDEESLKTTSVPIETCCEQCKGAIMEETSVESSTGSVYCSIDCLNEGEINAFV